MEMPSPDTVPIVDSEMCAQTRPFDIDADLRELHLLLQRAEPGRTAALARVASPPPVFETAAAVAAWVQDNVGAGRDSCELRFHAGLAYLEFRDFAAARDHFYLALSLNPSYGTSIRGIAVAALGLGNADESVACNLKVLEAVKDDPLGRNSFLRLMARRDVSEASLRAMFKARSARYFDAHPGTEPAISPVAKFADWCRAAGVSLHELDPSREIGAADGIKSTAPYVADAIRFAEIRGATVVSGWDFVIAPTGEVLDGSGYLPISVHLMPMPHRLQEGGTSVIHPWPRDCTEVAGPVLFLSAPVIRNVGHWITDFLPRLRGRALAAGQTPRIFVPRPLMRRYREFLSLFGVAEDDLVYADVGTRLRFESLYVMQHVDHNRSHPETVRFLSRHLNTQSAGVAHGVYLQRAADSRGRGIVNEEDVTQRFEAFGIKSLRLSEMPASQQCEILGSAMLVVTSWGAEMAAIFQMPRGCELVLLVPSPDAALPVSDADLDQFRRHADLLGIDMQILPCRTVGESGANIYYRDFHVDCDALDAALKKAKENLAAKDIRLE